jgi:2-oxo-3-hexenedioate decarboxylase
MPLAPAHCDAIVAEALAAMDDARQIAPFSGRYPGLTLDDAYRILARLCTLRTVRGERVIGRKIGFTNRRLPQHEAEREPRAALSDARSSLQQ